MIELDSLLLIELVEIGVVAVNKNAALGDVSLEAGCGVAKGTGTRLNDVPERLFGISLDEGRPLDRPKLRPDADRLEIVENRLSDVGVGRVAKVVAGVEAFGVPRLGEQLLGLFGVVDRSRRLPVTGQS